MSTDDRPALPAAARPGLDQLRAQLARHAAGETRDPAPILAWLEAQRAAVAFERHLIPLRQAEGWEIDPDSGDISHRTGEFFGVRAVRTRAGGQREVAQWDQPILTQREGGVLGFLARITDDGVTFLLNAKAEPGNLGTLQLAPTLQSTMSSLKRAHGGARPPFSDYFLGDGLTETIYQTQHNEEGGRFWRKSNLNCIRALRDPSRFDWDHDRFHWATLSQIKELMLLDNVVNPFVKTILSPL